MRLVSLVRVVCVCALLCVSSTSRVLAQTDTPDATNTPVVTEVPPPEPTPTTTPPPEFEPGTVSPATATPTTPTPTTPTPTTPAPTTPTPTTPAPTTPTPTTPAPTTPTPTTPAPTTLAPSTPAPTTPEPTTPTPTTPTPTTPAPTTPTPTTPAPTTPTPTTPAPTTPTPTTPAPTTPTPTTPAPTTPTPTTPAPTTLAPSTPAPTTPEPTTPTPTTPVPTTPTPTTPAPIFFTPNTTVNGSLVCGPRIRRSWVSLNPLDKQLYQDSVNASMVLGYHALFFEVHSQYDTAMESHRSCGFLYWHRRYLYAYESMLRSLEPRFACLTVPYWDYYADYAKFQATKETKDACKFENCSTFLQDMGGSAGPAGSNVINGIAVSGNCATAPFLSNFCHSSSASGASCNRCLPRSDWLSKLYPSSLSYGALARLLSGQNQFALFSQNLQYGTHNSIHNTAMGVMGTMATAADPIYYNHHATVDLVAQMFFECQVGRDMTELEKKTSLYAFQPCILTVTDICPTVLANMTMNVGASVPGLPSTKVETHPMLAPFFAPLPTQYWQWVSATDMGNFSYSYEKDTLFEILKTSGVFCPKNKNRRNLATVKFTSDTDVRTKSVIKTFNLFQNLYTDALLASSYNRDKALEQVELMDCQYYQDKFGYVDDFSAEFKAQFKLPATAKTTCARLLQDLQTGNKSIRVRDWKETFAMHLNYTN